jgi:hypothetical protein
MGYRLDGRNSIPGRGKTGFFYLKAHPTSCLVGTGYSFPEGQSCRCEIGNGGAILTLLPYVLMPQCLIN